MAREKGSRPAAEPDPARSPACLLAIVKPRTHLSLLLLHRYDEQPITDKTVWLACTEAAKKAGIGKRVSPTWFATRGPRICSKPAPTWRTIQLLLGDEDLEATARDPHACAASGEKVANPLEELKLSSIDQTRPSTTVRVHDAAVDRSGRHRPS